MANGPRVLTDDLARKLLDFFPDDAFIPARALAGEREFVKKYPPRKVRKRAQHLRAAGFLEKKGERSGLAYRRTAKGREHRETLNKNGHRQRA